MKMMSHFVFLTQLVFFSCQYQNKKNKGTGNMRNLQDDFEFVDCCSRRLRYQCLTTVVVRDLN